MKDEEITMKITIYQINSERDTKRIKFVPLDRLKDVQNNEAVDSKLYDKIYENEMELKNLEDVYYTFNMKKPPNFKGHSLSVSDVVEISECENLDDGFYFCDRIGFKKINFDNEKCIQISFKSQSVNSMTSKPKVKEYSR